MTTTKTIQDVWIDHSSQSMDSDAVTVLPDEIEAELKDFAEGVEGVKPEVAVVEMARRITQTVVDNATVPDVTFDMDGGLSFDVRLKDGRLVMAELEVCGAIDASVFDSHNSLLKHLPRATEQDIAAVLKT